MRPVVLVLAGILGVSPLPPSQLTARTVLLGARTQDAGCVQRPLPDRRCSPGAFYPAVTRAVLCSSWFRTRQIRRVSEADRFAVEREYGLPARHYGRTIEIDHIVPLELGGSNDIANLFPQPGAGAATYRDKDRLENRLHELVCAGKLTLGAARRGIARNWLAQYRRLVA